MCLPLAAHFARHHLSSRRQVAQCHLISRRKPRASRIALAVSRPAQPPLLPQVHNTPDACGILRRWWDADGWKQDSHTHPFEQRVFNLWHRHLRPFGERVRLLPTAAFFRTPDWPWDPFVHHMTAQNRSGPAILRALERNAAHAAAAAARRRASHTAKFNAFATLCKARARRGGAGAPLRKGRTLRCRTRDASLLHMKSTRGAWQSQTLDFTNGVQNLSVAFDTCAPARLRPGIPEDFGTPRACCTRAPLVPSLTKLDGSPSARRKPCWSSLPPSESISMTRGNAHPAGEGWRCWKASMEYGLT